MTLNVAVASPKLIVMAADRRLTTFGATRRVVTERSTKLTVLRCRDALALIAYNGVGRIGAKTPADWLQDLEARDGLTSMGLMNVIRHIRKYTKEQIAQLGPRDQRHSFIIGAWGMGKTWIYVVSNYESAASPDVEQIARDTLTATGVPQAPGLETRLLLAGDTSSVLPQDSEKVMAVAKKGGARGVDVKNLCVKLIQNAAKRRPRGPVGSSVLWAVAERFRGVEWGLDVRGGTRVLETPNLIIPKMMLKDVRVEGPHRGRFLTEGMAGPLVEHPCSQCRNPVPLGYLLCGVCGHPI